MRDEDKTGGEDHAEGSPLDGVEELGEWCAKECGLAEEGEQELDGADGCEGESGGDSGMCAVAKMAKEEQRERESERCGVEGDGVEMG